ncbi:MAG TPA: tyrosine-type recombinase/integrase [Mycobacteriales bacterium]|nr:tyrosine-type recombinase/integrase [Mycobacteriales bacterium]
MGCGDQPAPQVLRRHPAWVGVGDAVVKRNTIRSYEAHIRLHLIPHLGPVRIDRLRPGHIADLVDAINDRNDRIRAAKASTDPQVRAAVQGMRPVAPATLHRIRATLRKALNDAIRQQLITTNPAVHVELPSGKRPKPVVWTDEHLARWRQTAQIPSPVMVWTPEQTGHFLDFAAGDRLYPLYHLIAFRGLRRGEACGLHWADLNLTGHTLTVRWQLLQYGWETGLDDPKTDASADTIALDVATAAVLSDHRARQHTERAAAGAAWHESGLVFTTPTGHPVHPADVTDRFARLAAAAELPPVRLHDLRHGAATLTLAAGADMKIVSQLLRHSSITITADTYTSVLPQVARDAAEKTAALVPRARARTLGPPSGAHQTTVDSHDGGERSSEMTKDQVNNGVGPVLKGAPPGTRTPNPRIKSGLD